MFLAFQKKLEQFFFLKMKFWAACRTGIYYHSGTGKQKKLFYAGVLKVKGDWGIFSCLKNLNSVKKGKSWENMKVSCFT